MPICDSNAYEHIGAVRMTESAPGGHLIGGTQSVSVPVPVPQDKNGQPAVLSEAGNANEPDWPKDECPRQTIGPLAIFVHYIAAFPIFANTVDVKRAH